MVVCRNILNVEAHIQSTSISSININKAFDFSVNYTTISHSNVNDRLKDLVQLCFTKENA